MRVSVIIPAYNAETTLPLCLTALLRQTRVADEIIVVDNRSTDRTGLIACELARQHGLIRLIREERPGEGPARNQGVAEATGEILVFTDADCVPDRDWLERLIAPFYVDPALEAVAGVILGYNPKTLVQKCISITTFPAPEQTVTIQGLSFPPPTFYTANFAIRRDVMSAVGGFDEGIWPGQDVDLCLRLLRRGGRIRYAREASVRHIQRETLCKMMFRQFQYGTGVPALLRKHYPNRAWLTLPGRVMLPLPGWLSPCWVNLAAPDRILLLLFVGSIWQPWVGALAGLYMVHVGRRLHKRAQVQGVPIASWELPLVTGLHIGEFSAFTAGCFIAAFRTRVLCIA